jgi:L-fucose dehydrogenase
MDLQLKDKVIIVTGGAKGIGAGIVQACAADGAIPVIVGRDADAGSRCRMKFKEQAAAAD